MAQIDDDIDRLYQLPLKEFTPARNALAKDAGRADIKALEKPTAPAWAANQLYWRRRPVYDKLIAATQKLHAAHRAMLAGKAKDLAAAEAAHRAAIKEASEQATRMLDEAGEKPSETTIAAIKETLDALPASGPPGRLTKPLRRMGFEALAGADIRVPARKPQPPAKDERTAAAREREAAKVREREVAKMKEQLRGARDAERQAKSALERAKFALAHAEREQVRLEKEAREAVEAVETARTDLAKKQKAHMNAAAEREEIETKLSSVE